VKDNQINRDAHRNLDSLNQEFPFTAVKGIQCMRCPGYQREWVICSLADGRIVKFMADLEVVRKIQSNLFAPQIDFLASEELPAFWNYSLNSVGSQEALIKKIRLRE
jgi:hypothetical protein